MEDSFPSGNSSNDFPSMPARKLRQVPKVVRQVTMGLIALWLALTAGLGWWMSQRIEHAWLDSLTASAEYEAQTTARVVDRLFTEMFSVANMVASQAQVIQLAAAYRTDPPGLAQLTREERAAQFTRDPLVRKVGDFMNALSADLRYARIYMNNLSDDTVTASNWNESDSIVGMIYSRRPYLMDALRKGNGHSFGIARLNKSHSYFVSSRIDDANDVPQGSVTVKFDAPEMALFLTGRHISLIVNRQGRVTTTSSEPFVLRNMASLLPPELISASEDDEDPGAPMDIQALADERHPGQWLINGRAYLLQRQPLSNTQYQLLTLAPLDELAPMRRQHLITGALVAALGVALILLSSQAAGQFLMRRQEERNAALRTSALNVDLSAALTDAKTKDRQKVEVLGYIGHDLRAPLATISGYSNLLLANADENQHKILETIQRSVKYQLDLIDELLEYAKAELQPLTVHPGTTDLPRLLDDISEYAIALCSQQNNRFRYRASERMPRQVNLDGKRLQQVLLNLLSNAAKFTRDGTVTMSVTAQLQDDACALHFAVSDTGIGIDLNKNADIFGAFQHIQSASGSTGLGLFIAQRIVSAMGGTLSVTSIAEQGTTFSFVLSAPIVDPSDSNWSSAAQREVAPPVRRSETALYSSAKLDDQALDELATLALLGRLTDIERWIDRHSKETAHAPFMSHLRGLLDQFDFTAIEELALHSRSQSSV